MGRQTESCPLKYSHPPHLGTSCGETQTQAWEKESVCTQDPCTVRACECSRAHLVSVSLSVKGDVALVALWEGKEVP